MKFRTEIIPEKSEHPIAHNEKIITLGSCFADNIAEKMQICKFQVLKNPFGVLYNPVSIKHSLELLCGIREFTGEDLFNHLGEWHSFYHHSDFSDENKNRAITRISTQLSNSTTFLKSSAVIIITLGTSFVYKHKEANLIVSNCHKLPANNFDRFRLSKDELIKSITDIIDIVTQFNSNVRFLFTVSPIRHWKDGAVDNQLSKASLLLAVSEIVSKYDFCRYFPSYEIMMDDLRDYRFYDSDLLHPNQTAVNYIWEKFIGSEISRDALEPMRLFQKLNQAVNHRTKDNSSEAYMAFAEKQLEFIKNLETKFSYINLEKEKLYFKEKKG